MSDARPTGESIELFAGGFFLGVVVGAAVGAYVGTLVLGVAVGVALGVAVGVNLQSWWEGRAPAAV